MTIQTKPVHWLLTIFMALVTCSVISETVVYKSTDARGRVTYGDDPIDEAVDLKVLEFKPAANNNDDEASKRLKQMIATTKRLQEDRKDRESSRRQEQVSRSALRQADDENRSSDYPPYYVRQPQPYPIYDTWRRQPWDDYSAHSPLHLDLGYRSSRFNAALELGNRRHEHRRERHHIQVPLRQIRQPRAPSHPNFDRLYQTR